MILRIEFADGSNPYVVINKTETEIKEEINLWERNFDMEIQRINDGIIFAKAAERQAEINLFPRYMEVTDLNDSQILCLKQEMYYGNDEYSPLYGEYWCADAIPTEMVYERYTGIVFVEEDFA